MPAVSGMDKTVVVESLLGEWRKQEVSAMDKIPLSRPVLKGRSRWVPDNILPIAEQILALAMDLGATVFRKALHSSI